MSKYVEIMKAVALSLQEGRTVKDTAFAYNMSYNTLCRQLNKYNLTNKGRLIQDTPLDYTEPFRKWLRLLSEEFINIFEIAEFLGVTRDRVSSIYATAGIFVVWKLEHNHNDLLAASRRAELFVKNLGYKVIRDCYTCKGAAHQKASYDLILEKWGSIDVKSTQAKRDKHNNLYAAFNTQNFTKGVKYAFCVAMDEQRDDFVAVFAIPGKLVYGHSTIHITLEPLSKKYEQYKIWPKE